MWPVLFFLLASLTSNCYGNQASKEFLNVLPWETRDILLQLKTHLGVKELTDVPVPLYRPDIEGQVAYWMITYNQRGYAILSAGEHTGDNALLFQGKGESPLLTVQKKAQELNAECVSYTVMSPSPGMTLACDTAVEQVVEREMSVKNAASLWKKMQQKAELRRNKKVHDVTPESFFPVSAGHPGTFLFSDMRSIYIRPHGNTSEVTTLCGLLGVCDETGRVRKLQETGYGEVYVHLEPVQASKMNEDLHFEVVGVMNDNSVVTRRFVLEPTHRARRATSTYSIEHSTLMPDYNQFAISSCKYVGCGPVAWAQIFGFYDRLSHAGIGRPEAKTLYECGPDATTGSSTCQAPANMHTDVTRIQHFITKMHDLLGTFCLFDNGATYQSHMDDVADYFKTHLGFGNIQLNTNGNILTQLIGTYSDKIRNTAFGYVRAKWPVVVGFRVDGIFSQHYAVMTEYRSRTVQTSSGTETEYDMYMHMGWGGSGNGWRKAEMFMAAVAEY